VTYTICLSRAPRPPVVLTYADRERPFALKAFATGNASGIAHILDLEVDHHRSGQIVVVTLAGNEIFLGETP
jgi:hypothetical protein